MIARVPSSSWEICAASMLTCASPSSAPMVPITPGRSAYAATSRLPSARRSKCRELISISLATWFAPDSVPDTVRDAPSGIAARSVTDER